LRRECFPRILDTRIRPQEDSPLNSKEITKVEDFQGIDEALYLGYYPDLVVVWVIVIVLNFSYFRKAIF
jgi:hypothetical protein